MPDPYLRVLSGPAAGTTVTIAGDVVLGKARLVVAPDRTVSEPSPPLDSRYLYVLNSAFSGADTVLSYRINVDGTLAPIGDTAPFEGSSAGLASG